MVGEQAAPQARPSAIAPGSVADAARPLSVAIYMHDLTGGGVERQTLTLARELRGLGVAVTLVLHQLRGELFSQLPAGLEVVDLRSRRTITDIPRLARFLRRRRPDILVANLDHNNVAALLAKGLSASSSKIVICQHNPVSSDFIAYEGWTYRLIPAAYLLLSPLLSHAVAVSAGVAQDLRSVAHLPRSKVCTINNPVVGPDFRARSEAPGEHPWFGQPDHPVFVTAGRLVGQKDHETMLRALALHRRNRPSRLIVLGVGPLLERLQALTAELGLTSAVDFLGFKEDPLPYFRRADAFLLTSRAEGFGNVLVEAMACGTPVISTDCQHGPREILQDGRYGTLVAQHDPEAFAAAMDRLPELRARCPASMLRERADEFTNAACAARYLALFRSLVPGRGVTS